MKNINEILINPVRTRIIQVAAEKGNLTANDICELMPDIPRTTLYRHIKLLLDNQILLVVNEEKIRGSLERTLALNVEQIQKNNTVENASQLSMQFLLNKLASFQRYFSKPQANPGRDRIFLNNTVLIMNDAEFDAFLLKMRDLLVSSNHEMSEGRKARDLSILSTPIEE